MNQRPRITWALLAVGSATLLILLLWLRSPDRETTPATVLPGSDPAGGTGASPTAGPRVSRSGTAERSTPSAEAAVPRLAQTLIRVMSGDQEVFRIPIHRPLSRLACGPHFRSIDAVKPASTFSLVLVTAPDLKTARALSQAALKARLVACANLIPKIESHYWWQGTLESGAEVLIVFKTTRARLAALEKLILARHPYNTLEFLAVPIAAGNPRYLDWVEASCRAVPQRPRAS